MTPRSSFGVHLTGTGATRVIHATGRLVAGDGADADAWRAAGALGPLDHVLMDLGGVTALDAGGIGRLLEVRHGLATRGVRLSLATAAPRVRHVLTLVGLGAVFAPAPTANTTGRPRVDATPTADAVCRCA